MKRKKLLIISHTEHFSNAAGNIVGWGPTVAEINILAKEAGHIYHIACLHKGVNPPPSSAGYCEPNITFVPIPPAGGAGLYAKLKVIMVMPLVVCTVIRYLKKADVFQLRLPTGMGIYLLPFMTLFVRKPGWFKYAGNWNQQSPPLSYRVQRFWLKYCQRRTVTLNGKWPDQPRHCLSFENPCLTVTDRLHGAEVLQMKQYTLPLIACFAGRLEDAKGVSRVLEALQGCEHISEMHFIGDGPDRVRYEQVASKLKVKVFFHGFLTRDKVFEMFSKSHIFFLPSVSEGFPKVVAEAANFGCVPVVSNVSAIPQYVTSETGFVWDPAVADFTDFFNNIDLKDSRLENMAKHAYTMAGEFTFEKYLGRVRNLLGYD